MVANRQHASEDSGCGCYSDSLGTSRVSASKKGPQDAQSREPLLRGSALGPQWFSADLSNCKLSAATRRARSDCRRFLAGGFAVRGSGMFTKTRSHNLSKSTRPGGERVTIILRSACLRKNVSCFDLFPGDFKHTTRSKPRRRTLRGAELGSSWGASIPHLR